MIRWPYLVTVTHGRMGLADGAQLGLGQSLAAQWHERRLAPHATFRDTPVHLKHDQRTAMQIPLRAVVDLRDHRPR